MADHFYGRIQVPERPATLLRLHQHKGGTLKEVTHEPKVAVLDQEDLFAQGIYTSRIVQGAKDVTALGDCVFNAFMAACSNALIEDQFIELTQAASYADTKSVEIEAIRLYDWVSHATGTPATEWPPTDCGSSGLAVNEYAIEKGIVTSEKVASHTAEAIVSLLQDTGVMVGQPFLNAWETPAPNGFVDGNGSAAVLESQIRQGVAGGHETYICQVAVLHLTETGKVTAEKTVLRVRNSWSRNWGHTGSYYIHLSTYLALAPYCDFRQIVA